MTIVISRLSRHATVPFSLKGEDRELEICKVVGERYGFSLKEDCRKKEGGFDFYCEDKNSGKPIRVEIKQIVSSNFGQRKNLETFLEGIFKELEGKVQDRYLVWASQERVFNKEEGEAIKQEIKSAVLENKADLEGLERIKFGLKRKPCK